MRKIFFPPAFDPRSVLTVASRYTDCATRPTDVVLDLNLIMYLGFCSFNCYMSLMSFCTQLFDEDETSVASVVIKLLQGKVIARSI